jgi:hypothetical protein
MKTLAAAVKAGEYAIDAEGNLRAAETLVTSDEYEITLEAKGEVAVAQDRYTLVALDTCVTDELRLEGWARELVRRVQDLRKQADYRVEDRIEIAYEVDEGTPAAGSPGGPAAAGATSAPARGASACTDVRDVFTRYAEYIRNETLATALTPGRSAEVDRSGELVLEKGASVWVGVRRKA